MWPFKPNCYEMKTKMDVMGLIKALRHRDVTNVSGMAAYYLGELGDPSSVEPLISLLDHKSKDLRRRALKALVTIGLPEIESLIGVIHHKELQEKEAVIAMLVDFLSEKPMREHTAEVLVNLRKPVIDPIISLLKTHTAGKHLDSDTYQVALGILIKIGQPAVDPVISALRDFKYPADLARILGEIGDPRAVPPLLGLLSYESTYVREASLKSLIKIGQPAAGPLVQALLNRHSGIRHEAAAALGEIGWTPATQEEGLQYSIGRCSLDAVTQFGNSAVESLMQDLYVEDPRARTFAVGALGMIRDARAVEPLVSVLMQGLHIKEVVTALSQIGDIRAVEPLIHTLKYAEYIETKKMIGRALGNFRGTSAVERVIQSLANEKASGNKEALIIALGGMQNCIAMQPLYRHLADADREVRFAAGGALAGLGWIPKNTEEEISYLVAREAWNEVLQFGRPAADYLIDLLKHLDRHTMVNIIRTLGKLGCDRVLEPLQDLFNDPDDNIRWEAIIGVAKIGDIKAIELLANSMDHEDETRRQTIIKTLAEIRHPTVDKALLDALNGPKSESREQLATMLAELGDTRAADYFLSLFRNFEWRLSYKARLLVKLGDSRTAELCKIGLSDSNKNKRDEAAWMLGMIGHSGAIQPLHSVLHDGDDGVRRTARIALAKLGDENAIQSLSRDFDQAVARTDEYTACDTIEDITKTQSQKLVDTLIKGLDRNIEYSTSKWAVSRDIMRALGEIGDKRAVEPLIEYLKDLPMGSAEDSERITCIEALGKLRDPRAVESLLANLAYEPTEFRYSNPLARLS